MKVWQVIGIVEADGWQLVGTRGSHRQYKHPEKRGKGDDSGQAFRRLPPQDGGEHS
jgi:hypothetical protein